MPLFFDGQGPGSAVAMQGSGLRFVAIPGCGCLDIVWFKVRVAYTLRALRSRGPRKLFSLELEAQGLKLRA